MKKPQSFFHPKRIGAREKNCWNFRQLAAQISGPYSFAPHPFGMVCPFQAGIKLSHVEAHFKPYLKLF